MFIIRRRGMDNNGFWDNVRNKAYFLYLNRMNNNIPGNAEQDWNDAAREERIEEKIKEEAYYHYLQNGDYPLLNWQTAKNEITYRLNFLAFYLHEANLNKTPIENWVEAEKLYLSQF